MTEPRAKTPEEIRDIFLRHLHMMVDYWHNESRRPDTLGKLNGLVHSILATIDGASIGIPSFELVAHVHPDDKSHHISAGQNWIEDGTVINADASLHDLWYVKASDDYKSGRGA